MGHKEREVNRRNGFWREETTPARRRGRYSAFVGAGTLR
jgi:hypothetical protein